MGLHRAPTGQVSGSLACTAVFAHLFQCSLVGRIRKQGSCYSHRPRIRRRGNCRGTHSTDLNWSRRMSTIRLSIFTRFFNLGNWQAWRISSFKKPDTFITKHLGGKARRRLGNRYRVLIETAPDMVTECGVSAGIHTARIGGTTQTPFRVRSVITPLEANNSWSSG